ncbi:MAG: hypothetical protein HY652_07775 [Acidobacteria bacterium]|nr:hypothetical protein [Acidobacteriota bacterium]
MEKHVTLLGVLLLVYSLWTLLRSAFMFLSLMGVTLFGRWMWMHGMLPLPVHWLAGLGVLASAVYVIWAILNLAAAIGLIRQASWARVWTILASVLNIPRVPFGTALGIYGLWVCFSNRGVHWFAHGGVSPPPSSGPFDIP